MDQNLCQASPVSTAPPTCQIDLWATRELVVVAELEDAQCWVAGGAVLGHAALASEACLAVDRGRGACGGVVSLG